MQLVLKYFPTYQIICCVFLLLAKIWFKEIQQSTIRYITLPNDVLELIGAHINSAQMICEFRNFAQMKTARIIVVGH